MKKVAVRMTISGIDDNMDTSDCQKYTPKDRECVPEWTMLDILITATRTYNYPARACASKGLCDRSWCLLYIYILYICKDFFLSFKILTFRRPFQHRKASLRI